MKQNSILMRVISVGALTLLLTGCAGLGKRAGDGRNPIKAILADEEPQFLSPRSMVAIWKPSTYEKPGTKSLRGFGGRFYFHDANNEPVKVDGTLTIYGYDDASENSSGKADRKFVFKSDTFQGHHSDSGIGDSYSFWVPWDEVGGVERTITLIPVFKSVNGDIPQSQPATLRLPGRKPEVVASAQESLYGPGTQVISASGVVSEKPMVRQAIAVTDDSQKFEDSQSRPLPLAQGRKTTTLKLPRNLAARIASAESQPRPSVAATGDDDGRSNRPTKIRGDGDQKYADGHLDRSANASDGSSKRESGSPRSKGTVFGQPGSF